MSFQDWLFGSEKTAPDESATDSKTDAKKDDSSAKSETGKTETKSTPLEKKPEAPTPKTIPEKKSTPITAVKPVAEQPAKAFLVAARPKSGDETEHTQKLTREELTGLKNSAAKKATPKPEPAKSGEGKKAESVEAAKLNKGEDEKPTEPLKGMEKVEDEKKSEEPPPPPLKPAAWKTEPVTEAWCPPEISRECPGLIRRDYQDHIAIERIVSPDWRVIGGSRRGRKQAFDHRFREDAMAFTSLPEATVLCVSDGAGSSKFSRLGSYIAVHETATLMAAEIAGFEKGKTEKPDVLEKALKEALKSSLDRARERIIAIAGKSNLPAKEFRGTMLTVVHFKNEKCELMIANQIGDGAVCFLKKDKTIMKLASKDSGKFSGEVSCFFTDDEAKLRTGDIEVFKEVDDIEAVFLCSDGIEDPFYPIDKRALEIFQQWYSGVQKPLKDFKDQPLQPAVMEQEAAAWALAQWLEFEKRGENDDRTVLLMHRRPINVKF